MGETRTVRFGITGEAMTRRCRGLVLDGLWGRALRELQGCAEGLPHEGAVGILEGTMRLAGDGQAGLRAEPEEASASATYRAGTAELYGGGYRDAATDRAFRPYACADELWLEDIGADYTPGSGDPRGRLAKRALRYADDPGRDRAHMLDLPGTGACMVLFAAQEPQPPPWVTLEQDPAASLARTLELRGPLERRGWGSSYEGAASREMDRDPAYPGDALWKGERAEARKLAQEREIRARLRTWERDRAREMGAFERGLTAGEGAREEAARRWAEDAQPARGTPDRGGTGAGGPDAPPAREATGEGAGEDPGGRGGEPDPGAMRREIAARADAPGGGGWLTLDLEAERRYLDPGAPALGTLRVPRAPFVRWALRAGGRHAAPAWENVSGRDLKMEGDSADHSDWWLGAGLDPGDAYRRDAGTPPRLQATQMATYAAVRSLQRELLGHDCAVLSGQGATTGTAVHPGPDEEVPAGSVAIVPHAGPEYWAAARSACAAGDGAVVAEAGGRLAHLALLGREPGPDGRDAFRLVVVRDARRLYPAGGSVRVDCARGRVELTPR